MCSLAFLHCRLIQSMASPAASLSEAQQVDVIQATATYFFDSHQYDLASAQLRSLLEHPILDAQHRI